MLGWPIPDVNVGTPYAENLAKSIWTSNLKKLWDNKLFQATKFLIICYIAIENYYIQRISNAENILSFRIS